MIELDETKSIIKASYAQILHCELVISYICEKQITRRFVHNKAIKHFAKIFNISLDQAEEIYTAVRYFEIQP